MTAIKRVAYLSMHSSPLLQPGTGDAGGMNVYVDQLARTMAERGVEVDVFTRRVDPADPEVIEAAPKYRVINIDAGPPHQMTTSALIRVVVPFARQVIDQLRLDPPQVIHSHYWLSGWAGLLAKRALGLPLANSFHTLGRVKNRNRAPGEAPESLVRIAAEREVIANSDCVMASTPAEAHELLEFYGADPNQLCTSPPGVDHRVFRPGSKIEARRRLGLSTGPIILFVGRIQPLKGPDIAIKAMEQVVERFPDAHLVVVGGPSGNSGWHEVQKLRQMAASGPLGGRVRFVAPLPHGLLVDVYRSADLLLVPSRSESFGLVAAEAQACGVPVVASRVGGLQFVVDHGNTGLLVEGWRPKDFAEAIVSLLEDSERLAAMRKAAFEWAKRFSWEGTVDKHLELYRVVLEQDH